MKLIQAVCRNTTLRGSGGSTNVAAAREPRRLPQPSPEIRTTSSTSNSSNPHPFVWSHLGVVGRLLDDLRRHPERRPHERLPLDLRVGQLTGDPKVGQLHLALLRQQDVGSCGESRESHWIGHDASAQAQLYGRSTTRGRQGHKCNKHRLQM